MCRFLSAIVSKSGEIYCDPFIDSHEDILQRFGLRDDSSEFINNLVRVEFTPQNDDFFDVEKYDLIVDEKFEPDWFAELRESVYNKLKERIKRMIIKKADNQPLCGGGYIVQDSKISWTKYCRILAIQASTIENVFESSIIEDVLDDSTIKNVYSNARIKNIRDNSTIEHVRGNAKIENVRDNATIGIVQGNSTIKNVWDNATIENVWDNARIINKINKGDKKCSQH